MPDSKAKRDWMKENTRNLVVKINRNTDADIFAFLDTLTVSYASVIKLALREYMERHGANEEEKPVKKIVVFESTPDYVFSDDERGNTVLIWPDFVVGMDTCFRCREIMESGEVLDYRIYGYDIPNTAEEMEDIMESIRTGDASALEWL